MPAKIFKDNIGYLSIRPEMWNLNFRQLPKMNLNQKIGLFHTALFQLRFIKAYTKRGKALQFLEQVNRELGIDLEDERYFLFDPNHFDFEAFVSDEESCEFILQSYSDSEIILKNELNNTFSIHLERSTLTNLDFLFVEGIDYSKNTVAALWEQFEDYLDEPVYIESNYIKNCVPLKKIPEIENWYDSKLDILVQGLEQCGMTPNMKRGSFFSKLPAKLNDISFYKDLVCSYTSLKDTFLIPGGESEFDNLLRRKRHYHQNLIYTFKLPPCFNTTVFSDKGIYLHLDPRRRNFDLFRIQRFVLDLKYIQAYSTSEKELAFCKQMESELNWDINSPEDYFRIPSIKNTSGKESADKAGNLFFTDGGCCFSIWKEANSLILDDYADGGNNLLLTSKHNNLLLPHLFELSDYYDQVISCNDVDLESPHLDDLYASESMQDYMVHIDYYMDLQVWCNSIFERISVNLDKYGLKRSDLPSAGFSFIFDEGKFYYHLLTVNTWDVQYKEGPFAPNEINIDFNQSPYGFDLITLSMFFRELKYKIEQSENDKLKELYNFYTPGGLLESDIDTFSWAFLGDSFEEGLIKHKGGDCIVHGDNPILRHGENGFVYGADTYKMVSNYRKIEEGDTIFRGECLEPDEDNDFIYMEYGKNTAIWTKAINDFYAIKEALPDLGLNNQLEDL